MEANKKLKLPRKAKKIITNKCKINLKLQGLKFKSLIFTEINKAKRYCFIDYKIKD